MGKLANRQGSAPGWFAWAGVAGPLAFVALDLLAASLRPGYSLVHGTISRLAVGPLGWLQTLNFVLVAACTILLGIGLWARARWLGGLFVLWGMGFLLIAIFPMDPLDRHSLRQRLHYLMLDGITVLFPIMCLTAVFTFWQPQRRLALFSLAVFLFAAAVSGSFLIGQEQILESDILGLYERFVIWIAAAWCVVVAWNVGRMGKQL
jgi:hypothetical membrane protein